MSQADGRLIKPETLTLLRNTILECFAQGQFHQVGIREICQKARVSPQTVYKYFGNKEGLFTAICDYRREVFFKGVCFPYTPEKNNLRIYLIQTLQRFYQHIVQPENIAFMRMFTEQTQKDIQLAQYFYDQCALNIQNTIAFALGQAHDLNEIYCSNPHFSAMMYFGILRDVEWRLLMGLEVSANDAEITDYINYSVDLFLKAHQKV